jgi:magnesium-protoporphyrin O-methyltransferase
MPCSCRCAGTASHFDQRRARRDRERYERHGPDSTTSLLLEELRRVTRPGDTLLDVGGGIGVLGLELQAAGVGEVILVEAAPAFLAEAQGLMARSASATRFRTVSGDFAELTPPLAADIVTLDRVVCCYPDFAGLLRAASISARRILALSFPKDRWYVRLVIGIENLLRRVRGDSFRAFVHPPAEMAALLHSAGWRRRGQRTTLAWCIECWGRSEVA